MESWGIVRTSWPPVGVVPAKPGIRRSGSESSVSCTSALPCRSACSVMIVLLVCPGRQSKLRMTASVCGAPCGPSFPTALSHVAERMPPSPSDRTVSTLNSQTPSPEPRSPPVQAPANARAERVALRVRATRSGHLHPSFMRSPGNSTLLPRHGVESEGFVGQVSRPSTGLRGGATVAAGAVTKSPIRMGLRVAPPRLEPKAAGGQRPLFRVSAPASLPWFALEG